MLYVLGYTHPLAPKNTTKQKIEKGERRRKKERENDERRLALHDWLAVDNRLRRVHTTAAPIISISSGPQKSLHNTSSRELQFRF